MLSDSCTHIDGYTNYYFVQIYSFFFGLTGTSLYDTIMSTKYAALLQVATGSELFMYNENAKNRTIRYMKGSRDKLTINLPKGKKDEYKEYAQSKGMSLTELIMSLIEADMKDSSKEQE